MQAANDTESSGAMCSVFDDRLQMGAEKLDEYFTIATTGIHTYYTLRQSIVVPRSINLTSIGHFTFRTRSLKNRDKAIRFIKAFEAAKQNEESVQSGPRSSSSSYSSPLITRITRSAQGGETTRKTAANGQRAQRRNQRGKDRDIRSSLQSNPPPPSSPTPIPKVEAPAGWNIFGKPPPSNDGNTYTDISPIFSDHAFGDITTLNWRDKLTAMEGAIEKARERLRHGDQRRH